VLGKSLDGVRQKELAIPQITLLVIKALDGRISIIGENNAACEVASSAEEPQRVVDK
jgi:hypothetical protein